MSENDRQDVMVDAAARISESACQMVALAKEGQTNVKAVVYVDNDGNDAVAYVYDSTSYSWKSGDTFDALAKAFLGDASLGPLMAYYNGIANEAEIEAGTRISVPVLEETAGNQSNRIYAEPDRRDNYGRDISVGDSGEFRVDGGDFGTVGGSENLSQAISLRLTTAAERRIRLGAYGIRSTVGDVMAVQSYLLGSIEQTLRADPRISEVEEIAISGRGDALHISVTYTDINGEGGRYEGEV